MADPDLEAIRAELARRGVDKPRKTERSVTEYQPTDNAVLLLLVESFNRMATAMTEMRSAPPPPPRVRRIERDEAGNITAIVEE